MNVYRAEKETPVAAFGYNYLAHSEGEAIAIATDMGWDYIGPLSDFMEPDYVALVERELSQATVH